MMILGVAVWFFPRPKKDDKKYNPDLVKGSYWVFTGSTLIRFVAEIFHGIYPQGIAGELGFLCSLLQVLSAIMIIYSIWGRIRPVGSQIREQKGEKF